MIAADIIARGWRKLDIKLVLDGDMHVLRWRRGLFMDEVLFDDRRVATAQGLLGRETIFGFEISRDAAEGVRLLLTIDPRMDWNDWSGEGRLAGARLETADETLIAVGSLGPDRIEPFRVLFDRAVKAIGLS